jgi:RNA polymerase-interacting CarD/CdnL/TRCF family regulator
MSVKDEDETAIEQLDDDTHQDDDADEEIVDDAEEESDTGASDEEKEGPTEEEDGDVVVAIEGEEEEKEESVKETTSWVRDLRRVNREKERRIKELEAKINALGKGDERPKLGPKPKLEDFDYDSDKFDSALSKWYEDKLQDDKHKELIKAKELEQEKAWKEKLGRYTEARNKLKVGDFEDAEELVQDLLDITQQGIIIQGARRPDLVVYAIGKNPKKAKELAAIKNPVDFAFAVADLERNLKVTTKKSVPSPESVVKGNGGTSGAISSRLNALRAEAEKTGDYTKVLRYKREMAKSKSN